MIATAQKRLYGTLKFNIVQATGCSGMIAFWLDGDLEATKKLLAELKVFTLAESLGGFESLAEHPYVFL